MGFFSKGSSGGEHEGARSRWLRKSGKSSSRSSSSEPARPPPAPAASSSSSSAGSRGAPVHSSHASLGRSSAQPAPQLRLAPLREVGDGVPGPSGSGLRLATGGVHPGGAQAPTGATAATPAPAAWKGKGREDDSTVLLANRLRELAVSNADGLLGDEEYRLLRQEVFEQMSAMREQAKREARVNGAGSDLGHRESLRTPTPGQQVGNDRPPSTHSGHSRLSNLGSLFNHKKPSHELRQRESSSLFSGGYSQSHRASERTSHDRTSSARARHISTDAGVLGSGGGSLSIRSGRTGYSSMLSSADRERPPSLFSSSTGRTGSIVSSAGGVAPPSAFNLRTLQDGGSASPAADARPDEIRKELASVEAEGRRLLAVFDGLKDKARAELGDHGAGGGGGSSPVLDSPASDAGEWTVINHSPSLGSIGKLANGNGSNSGRGSEGNGGPHPLKPALKKTSYSMAPSAVTQHSSGSSAQHHLRERESIASMSSLPAPLQRRGTGNGQALPERSMLPPAFRTTTDPDQAALYAKLADIDRRRRDVQERYDRRLEFLRGKLRAAEIRERALR